MRGIVILLPFLILFSGGVFGQFQSKQIYSTGKDSTHVYFGPGYGSAYGGLGAQLQIVTSGSQPLGFHFGLGRYHLEDNPFLGYALGFKMYIAHLVYFSFRYSLYGQEIGLYTPKKNHFIWPPPPVIPIPYSKKLRGYGMYLGTDMLLIGRFGVNFAVGLNYARSSWYLKHNYYYRSDFGIFFRLD
jgi:hypothetical protein